MRVLTQAKKGARPVILRAEAQKILPRQLESHESEVFPKSDGRPYGRADVGIVLRNATRAPGVAISTCTICATTEATMALNKAFSAPIVMALPLSGWQSILASLARWSLSLLGKRP